MCTVTWLYGRGGYDLLCSRDEKHTRKAAAPPRVFDHGGVRWIAPTDTASDGTWISVNEFGISVCLLNGTGSGGRNSRGLLVRDLAPSRQPTACLLGMRLDAFAPFTLALLDPALSLAVWDWDGQRLKRLCDTAPPLASSSLAMLEARSARRTLYESLRPRSVADLFASHASHRPDSGALAPCMHRSDASTVSLPHVHTGPGRVEMSYHSGPLCRSPLPSTVEIHAHHNSYWDIHAGQ